MQPDSPYGPQPQQPWQDGDANYQPQYQQPQGDYPYQPLPPPPANPYYPYPQSDQPVAYDQYGNPLYSYPYEQRPQEQHQYEQPMPAQPAPQQAPQGQQASGQVQSVSDLSMQRYYESLKKYPGLNLSQGEFVICAFPHHPIGVIRIWIAAAGLILIFVALLVGIVMNSSTSLGGDSGSVLAIGAAITVVLSAFVVAGAFSATYIFNNNRLFLTNESLIEQVQSTLWAKREQTISLVNVEDASYRQRNFLETLFNYGSMRMSTQSEETTYRFRCVENPRRQIAIINNAVEAFKNGRAVDPDIVLNVPH